MFTDAVVGLYPELGKFKLLIGMEACSGSHFLGRALREQGHDVRLMPAQYVKPYVKTNKSDYIDAEAIAKSRAAADDAVCADQDGRAARSAGATPCAERWVMRRTAVVNQFAAFFGTRI